MVGSTATFGGSDGQGLVPGGFHHVRQSLRVVDVLEKDGRGLNLTFEVRDGILKHSKGRGGLLTPDTASRAVTLEGQVVRLADIIAYLSHDLDDAIRGEVIQKTDIPARISAVIGLRHSDRINRMVRDLIVTTLADGTTAVKLSVEMDQAICELRSWLFESVYRSDLVHRDFVKASHVLRELFLYFIDNESVFLEHGGRRIGGDPLEVSVADFIAGMTDRFVLTLYHRLFMPEPWRSI